jgi:hypothetical protein
MIYFDENCMSLQLTNIMQLKIKVSKELIKEKYGTIIKVPYCGLQYLLTRKYPFAYSICREGWACDYYNINNIIVSTGHSPIGIDIDYTVINKYEIQAKEIFNNSKNFEMLDLLRYEFIFEVTNKK